MATTKDTPCSRADTSFRNVADCLLRSFQRAAKGVSRMMRPVVVMLLLGCVLWFLREYVDGRTMVRVAAGLHFLGASPRERNRTWDFLLTASFSLYTVFLTDQFIEHPLFVILVMGGLFEQAKRMVESTRRWHRLTSPACAVLVFLLSMTVTRAPNVLLQAETPASTASEYAYFFFRPADPNKGVRSDGVVIWQEPAPARFPFDIRPCFAFHHSALSFLPFSVWPTMEYSLGSLPTVKITHLRIGHGTNTHLSVPVAEGRISTVTQFHRVHGTFDNLPSNNDQLHLRVLVLPKKKVSRLSDKSRRWWVQPRDETGSDGAVLKVIHRGDNSGTWYCDVFFGAPQDQGDPFEIMAVITSRDLKRGERIRVKDTQELAVVCDRVTVLRE